MISQRKVAASKVIQARRTQLRQGPVSPRLVRGAMSECAAGAPGFVLCGRSGLSPLSWLGRQGDAHAAMAWFYRVVELDDGGGWACRFGRLEYDVHAELAAAVEHLRLIAGSEPALLFVHRLDGTVDAMGAG